MVKKDGCGGEWETVVVHGGGARHVLDEGTHDPSVLNVRSDVHTLIHNFKSCYRYKSSTATTKRAQHRIVFCGGTVSTRSTLLRCAVLHSLSKRE